MADHERLESQVAAWVLGALDAADARLVAAHVESCPTCRPLAARLGGVVAVLPLAAGDARPPDSLRARILTAAVAGGQVEPEPEDARVIPLRRLPRPRPRRVPWPAAAVAAMAVALIGLTAWNLSLAQQLAQPATQRYALHGTGPMAGVQGEVVYLKKDGIALVDFRNLPAVAGDRVYEAWLIGGDGKPVPAAVFRPDPGGSYTLLLARSIAGVKVIAVTSEPAPDGSPQPTQQPMLAAQLA